VRGHRLTHPKGCSDPVPQRSVDAWTAVARIVWVLGVDPNDETGGPCGQIGSPTSRWPPAGVGFSIGDASVGVRLRDRVDTSSVTAVDLMAASALLETDRARGSPRVRSCPLERRAMETVEVMKQTVQRDLGPHRRESETGLKVKAKRRTTRTGKRVGWVSSCLSQSASPVRQFPSLTVWAGGRWVVTSSFSPSFSNQSAQSAQSGSEGVVSSVGRSTSTRRFLFMNDDVSTRRCAQSGAGKTPLTSRSNEGPRSRTCKRAVKSRERV